MKNEQRHRKCQSLSGCLAGWTPRRCPGGLGWVMDEASEEYLLLGGVKLNKALRGETLRGDLGVGETPLVALGEIRQCQHCILTLS